MPPSINVLLNELSFSPKLTDKRLADEKMGQLADTIRATRECCDIVSLTGHSCLAIQAIAVDYKFSDWVKTQSQDTRILFFNLILNGPFIDVILQDECKGHNCEFNGEDVKNSSLAGGCHYQNRDEIESVLISFEEKPCYRPIELSVNFSPDNVHNQSQYLSNFYNQIHPKSSYHLRYIPNPKHDHGGAGTFMDLPDSKAQEILNNGFRLNRRVFGYCHDNGRYYEFKDDNLVHPDACGSFHGYPVEESKVPVSIRKKLISK